MTHAFFKIGLVLVFLLTFWVQPCQALPDVPQQIDGYEVEEEVDLGFGFRAVMLLVPTSWEIGHFGFLYYRDERICRVGTCAVSPSGDYVIFQEGPSAHVFLYRRADGKQTRLTIRPVPIVTGFVWHEETGTVDWHYGTESRSIQKAMEQRPVEEQRQ